MTFIELLVSLRTSEQPVAQRACVAWDLLLSHGFSEDDAARAAMAMLGELQFVRIAYPSHPKRVAHLARVVTVDNGQVIALSKCGGATGEIAELFTAPQESFKWGDEVPRFNTERCVTCFRRAKDAAAGPLPRPWRPR